MSKKSRSIAALRWIVPPLLALAMNWPGLMCWFQKDDFAWLGLYGMIHNRGDFWNAMFHPYAQGTVRTLSERVVYTSFFALFGMHALPYRMLAFLTHAANLTLINRIGEKLSGGSRWVGFLAAILWTINGSMAIALAWTAIYYELLCAFVFLAGLWFLIRYAETSERRFLIAQWMTYLIGFLVLEQNVVYPAIALAYAWCLARHVARAVYPMFVPALLYTAIHFAVAPALSGGPYRMHWDLSVVPTLWMYWKIALGPIKLINLGFHPSPGRAALVVALTAGLVGFLIWKMGRRDWKCAFGAAWFLSVLAPLLPLRDHISDYYLTIALAGLALWGAFALREAWATNKSIAVGLFVVYAAVNVPLTWVNTKSFYDRSEQIRALVEGVVAQSREHPGAAVVLKGVEPEMFWSAILHHPFRLYGLTDVYVVSGDRAAIEASNAGQDIGAFFVDVAPPGARLIDVSGGVVREMGH